jgi:hypothetical protein
MRRVHIEISGGHMVVADGDTPWLPESYMIAEVVPGFWTDSLTFHTMPGHE